MKLVGSPIESVPPSTWTESGRTPVLTESSSSRETATHAKDPVTPLGSCGNASDCQERRQPDSTSAVGLMPEW